LITKPDVSEGIKNFKPLPTIDGQYTAKKNNKLSFDTSNLEGMFGSAINAGVYLANSFKSPIEHESLVEEAPVNTNYVMGIPYVNKSFVTNRQRDDYGN